MSKVTSLSRRRKWMAPEVREVGDLARIVAKGQAKGKSPGGADGGSAENMDI